MSDDGFSEDDSSADEPACTDGLAEEAAAEEGACGVELASGALEGMGEEEALPAHAERASTSAAAAVNLKGAPMGRRRRL